MSNIKKDNKKHKTTDRELVIAQPGQVYGQVLRKLGNGSIKAHCFDDEKRICHVRGVLRKAKLVPGSIILVNLREYQDHIGDVVLEYNAKEVNQLKNRGEIPEDIEQDNTDNNIYFGLDSESETEIKRDKKAKTRQDSNCNNSIITDIKYITDSDEED